ncbi:sigma54 specific transcriptional regulator, Fis family [Desulfatibacillum aliphaticivorans]|uniref:Sigma54 specific transcriptional regulator, Fis family n=1 Tax=Desulfatibacillum aliphaticivorans TaxID=218208 RepID=B8FMY7_DESAL|nr:sigma 54-interacting transcriptional regulator [Desulfatibacillum aliphaticivorans]ACL05857.1 sigma54 specific transcriptional regulator, Fis family [Desulfatibacillum aliphaticivorans]
MVKADAFYRETTQALGEDGELEAVIHHCLLVLAKYVPADGLAIQLLEPSLKSIRTIVWQPRDEENPISGGFPEEMKEAILLMPPKTRDFLRSQTLPDIRIINRPEQDPISETLLAFTGRNYSSISMFLKREGKRFGSVTVAAHGRDRYTQEDLELFSLLKTPFSMAVGALLLTQEVSKLKSILDDRLELQKKRITPNEIIGRNQGLRDVVKMINLIAPQNTPVLINGETGVGKELIANAIHSMSPRKDGPLIIVNCGAIPQTLVESELFGHEAGAFTGAAERRKGRFERAHHGTIFLDEIGELKPDIQVKLLRVLQSQEIERVGGSKSIKVNARIIAATHRNLARMVSEGAFREDLYYRINVFPIVVPPLRTRTNDIPALTDHFIRKKSRDLKIYPAPKLDNKAIYHLMNYHWPGNVRELENIIERALILWDGGALSFKNLNIAKTEGGAKFGAYKEKSKTPLPLETVVADHIENVLALTKGRINGPNGAAKILDVNPSTLRTKMKKLGIPFKLKEVKDKYQSNL